jgi:predicted CoA-binding protein
MSLDGLTDDQIRHVLSETRRVAVVGASNRPDRPSHGVIAWLLAHGYAVVPVNPLLAGTQIQGLTVVGELPDAGKLDMVDVFRASEHAGALIDEAVRLGARTVWLQLGVVDAEAAERGRQAGLTVVMDRCPKIEFARLKQ